MTIHSLSGSRVLCIKVPFVAEMSALQDLQRSRWRVLILRHSEPPQNGQAKPFSKRTSSRKSLQYPSSANSEYILSSVISDFGNQQSVLSDSIVNYLWCVRGITIFTNPNIYQHLVKSMIHKLTHNFSIFNYTIISNSCQAKTFQSVIMIKFALKITVF